MLSLYDKNGLIFWSEEEIELRNIIQQRIVRTVKESLLSQNGAFQFFQVEGPTLIPRKYVSPEYDENDLFVTKEDDLLMRAETTASSYLYAEHLLNSHADRKVRMPFVVWQHAKSYRNEVDQVLKNMRLKEFYQLEFQILYSDTTKNDYSEKLIPAVCNGISELIGPCHTEPSDRIPSYSEGTTDVVCSKNNMEVCSISKRTDFPKEGVKVLEVAVGTDRCIYNFQQKD